MRCRAGRWTLTGGAATGGQGLAVIGQDRGDLKGGRLEEVGQKALGAGGGRLREALDLDPARGAIAGDQPVAALILVGQPRPVLDVDRHAAGDSVLAGLERGLSALLGLRGREVRDPVATQTAVQARARDALMNELPGYRCRSSLGKQQRLAQGHHHGPGRRQRGVQAMRTMRAVGPILPSPPLAHRRLAQVIAPGQLAGRGGRFAPFAADRRGRTGVLVQVDVQGSPLVGPRVGVRYRSSHLRCGALPRGKPLVALRAPAGSPQGQVLQNFSGTEQRVTPFR